MKCDPFGIYLFKLNNVNTGTMCEFFWKLAIKTPEWCHFTYCSIVWIVDFEQVNVGWVWYLVRRGFQDTRFLWIIRWHCPCQQSKWIIEKNIDNSLIYCKWLKCKLAGRFKHFHTTDLSTGIEFCEFTGLVVFVRSGVMLYQKYPILTNYRRLQVISRLIFVTVQKMEKDESNWIFPNNLTKDCYFVLLCYNIRNHFGNGLMKPLIQSSDLVGLSFSHLPFSQRVLRICSYTSHWYLHNYDAYYFFRKNISLKW